MELIDKKKVIAEIEKLESPIYPTLAEKLAYEDAIKDCKDIILANSIKTKEVDLEKELDFVKDAYYYFTSDERSSMKKVARHFFELGLKAREEHIKSIPLHGWQTPCADPNYPCENPQMDCINCPRFGYPQGTITMTSMDEKESEQGLVGKETFKTGSWSEIKEEKK